MSIIRHRLRRVMLAKYAIEGDSLTLDFVSCDDWLVIGTLRCPGLVVLNIRVDHFIPLRFPNYVAWVVREEVSGAVASKLLLGHHYHFYKENPLDVLPASGRLYWVDVAGADIKFEAICHKPCSWDGPEWEIDQPREA